MNEADIQIGLPCADADLCYWVGAIFGLLVLALIIAFILSAWRERQREQTKKTKSCTSKRTKH
jgi:uncharacterized membrane protein